MNLQTLFNYIGKGITSVGFVIFFMLFLIIGMIFLSHTLFVTVLESTAMTPNEVAFASWFLALGFEFTILITAVNTHHLNRALPIIFAVCSYFLLSFVLEAWTAETNLLKVIRHFIATMGATINYTYADLFQRKWSEAVKQKVYYELYEDLFESFNLSEKQLDKSLSANDELKNELIESQLFIKKQDKIIEELQNFKFKYESSLICPYCNQKQESPASLRAHKGHCKKNQKSNS